MLAGRLKQRITIQTYQPTKNSFNEWEDAWADWITVWASVEPASGSRYYEAKQAEAQVDGLVRIRYRTGIEPYMRIKYGKRILDIVSIVNPFENKKDLHLMYKERLG